MKSKVKPKMGRPPIPTGLLCPRCHNDKIIRFGIFIRSGGHRIQRVKCQECGHIFYDGELPSKAKVNDL